MTSLLCPRAARFTSLACTTRIFSTPAAIATRAPFSTTAQRPLSQYRPLSHHSRTAIAVHIPANRFTSRTVFSGLRHASTAPTAGAAVPEDALTWNRFFDLRKKRRYINLVASVITAVIAVGVGAPIIANQEFDSWGAQISGMDPMIVLGVTTFAVAGAGWLCGPSFGNSMFSLWAARRGWNKLIAQKEKSFYARIKRYRADPASSSPQNPIPDYYGEKIASVKDYRRWLKDQRAFNLKKNKNMI